MNTIKDQLEQLNFHDSEIERITLESPRKCSITINYYNWEGNDGGQKPWKWKKLKITFDFLAIIEWNAPDLINSPATILDTRFDDKIDELIDIEQEKKKKYKSYRSPLFGQGEDCVSITFILSSFDDWLNEDGGYLRLIGSRANIQWLSEGCYEGQIHIPIRES